MNEPDAALNPLGGGEATPPGAPACPRAMLTSIVSEIRQVVANVRCMVFLDSYLGPLLGYWGLLHVGRRRPVVERRRRNRRHFV